MYTIQICVPFIMQNAITQSGVTEYFNIKHPSDGHFKREPVFPTDKRKLEQTTVYMDEEKITVLAVRQAA